MAKRRRKTPTRVIVSRLHKKADRALSLYVRAKTFVEFGGKCAICQVNPIEACFHFVRRRRKILRWDIRNVIGTCHRCNYLEYRNPDPSRAWYIRQYGLKRYLTIVDLSHTDFDPTPEFLQSVIDRFTYLLAYLKSMEIVDALPDSNTDDDSDDSSVVRDPAGDR